jgi:dolichol-phosphate mannosyltransferase
MRFESLSFARGQTIATLIVMVLNYTLNNFVTYRDRRLRGRALWIGLITFCLACGLGVVINVAVSNEAFHHGVPWLFAALSGLLFSAVWNYGVTSMTTWRQTRRSSELRARRRIQAAVDLGQVPMDAAGEKELPTDSI